MKYRPILFIAAITITLFSCKPDKKGDESNITLSPESGTAYKSGQDVPVKLSYPADIKADSIVYLVDSVRVAVKKDSSVVTLKTDALSLGPRVITGKLYQQGKSLDISTNIVLMPAKAPQELAFTVEKVFPHDTSAYTEGLLYQDGYLYESTGNSAGNKGESDLRKVDLNTGKVVQRVKLPDPNYFGEGSAIVGDKIIMFTYTEKIGFVFDKKTFKLVKTFNNKVGVEGWGVTNDGNKLYLDDSTNRIWFLNKDNYNSTGFIDVYDDKGPIQKVNELEYIDGKLYSNIYMSNNIIIIDSKTGAVLQTVDMSNLWPMSQRPAGFDNEQNVLNGIAWDAKGKRLFVTGKKWPHLYQIKLSVK